MQTVEAEGLTIDDAIAKALESLQVGRQEVDIEIVSDATRGLFGLGGKPARVRATIRESLWGDVGQEPRDEASEQTSHGSGRGGEAAGRREGGERGSRRRGGEVWKAEESARPATNSAGQAVEEDKDTGRDGIAVSREAGERGAEFLGKTLELMGIQAKIEVEAGEQPFNELVLQVSGEACGIVIGRHGQTIDAIEYIVNRLVAREYPSEGHIVVDAAGYRVRRRQSLSEMAHRLAEKAKRERRTVTLNPLSPRDRRVVHIALKNERGITTRSHGAGLHRKLLIIPAGQGRRQYGGTSEER